MAELFQLGDVMLLCIALLEKECADSAGTSSAEGGSSSLHSTQCGMEVDTRLDLQETQSTQRMEPVEEEWSCQDEGIQTSRQIEVDGALAGSGLQVSGTSSNAAVHILSAPGEFGRTPSTTRVVGMWPKGDVSPPAVSQMTHGLTASSSAAVPPAVGVSVPAMNPWTAPYPQWPSPSHVPAFFEGLSQPSHPVIPNTGYNSVPQRSLPYGDQSLPLGHHLLPATIEKI